MASKARYFSKHDLREYRAFVAKHDALAEMQRVHLDYIETKGGLTLDVWRLMRGPWFGEPQMVVGVDNVADALGVPVSDVMQVIQETYDAVRPKMRTIGPQLDDVADEVRAAARRHARQHN